MIKLGRVRFWLSTKKNRLNSYGFWGSEYVLRTLSPDVFVNNSLNITKKNEVWTIFTSKKEKQKAIKKGLAPNNFGFSTYWVWRFFLSIHTKSYYAQNG